MYYSKHLNESNVIILLLNTTKQKSNVYTPSRVQAISVYYIDE